MTEHSEDFATVGGNEPETDRLYLDLLGARERLCRAQMLVPRHWSSDLQAALDHIDLAGSALCPKQWSRFNQPDKESA